MKINDIERRIADIIAINPRAQQPRALVAMGRELLSRDVEAATKCFDKAISIDQRCVPAWVGRCEALCMSGRKAQAAGCLERALDVEPNNAEVKERKAKLLAELAVASSKNRRYEPPPAPPKSDPLPEAKPQARPEPRSERKIEAKPEPEPKSEPKSEPRPEPEPKSEPEPEPTPKSEPKPAPAPDLVIESHRMDPSSDARPEPPKSEPPPEAKAEPATAPAVDPALDEAQALLSAGKHIQALRKVEPLTKSPDASAEVWRLRAEICTALDQLDEAHSSCERATKADAKSVAAWLDLARARVRLKGFERALDAADQALRLAPFDGSVQKLRGTILVALKQHSVAVSAFEKATQHAPDDAEAWLHLGRALVATKKTDGARQALQRAGSLAEMMQRDLVPAIEDELEKLK